MLCAVAHLCAGKRAKKLFVNVENVVIDMYYHFHRSAKQKDQLRQFMSFIDNEVGKVINHVCTMWLSLGNMCRENIDTKGLLGILFSV